MAFYRLLALCLILGVGILPAQTPQRPNVLLMVSDDLTACLASYGNPVVHTPHLDRLAGQGVQFERAYCQYPVCGPSRASFMSGLYPNSTKILANSYDIGSYRTVNQNLSEHPSIGGFLKRNGFFSARVSKIFHMGVPGGIEEGSPGGDDPDSWEWTYNVIAPETHSPGKLELLSPNREHYGSNFARVILPDGLEKTQADVLAAEQAIAILETRKKKAPDQPFFLAVGFVRPHVPLVAPKRWFDQYKPDEMTIPSVPEGDLEDVPEPAAGMKNFPRYGMNDEQKRQSIAGYYASVSFMDEQVGKILDALDRLELRENTIVIFISDHGYNLGEHDCWQKLSLFDQSTRVPMIISAPDFENSAGQKTSAIVELIDLYPTIADLTGLADQAPANLQGISLRPLLEQPARQDWSKEYAYTVTYQNGESVRTSEWRYSLWGEAGEELYDIVGDPEEFTNLARSDRHGGVLEEMRALLTEARKQSQDARGD